VALRTLSLLEVQPVTIIDSVIGWVIGAQETEA